MAEVWHCPAMSPGTLCPHPRVPLWHSGCAPSLPHHITSLSLSHFAGSSGVTSPHRVVVCREEKVPGSPQKSGAALPHPPWLGRAWQPQAGHFAMAIQVLVGEGCGVGPVRRRDRQLGLLLGHIHAPYELLAGALACMGHQWLRREKGRGPFLPPPKAGSGCDGAERGAPSAL